MAELVENCPRCGANHITFDLRGQNRLTHQEDDWKQIWEAYGVCRKCHTGTIFVLQLTKYDLRQQVSQTGATGYQGTVNDLFNILGFVNLKDLATTEPPEHLPAVIAAAFREGATSLATNCWNAAGTMFRLGVDLATRGLLPEEGSEGGPNAKQRRDLGLRLPWLFDNGRLPPDLRDLSTSIKEDGNDGAHQGTLTQDEAIDLLDFTTALLERLYTEPARVKMAKERRDARRGKPA